MDDRREPILCGSHGSGGNAHLVIEEPPELLHGALDNASDKLDSRTHASHPKGASVGGVTSGSNSAYAASKRAFEVSRQLLQRPGQRLSS